MRRYSHRVAILAVTFAPATLLILVGCSSGGDHGAATKATPSGTATGSGADLGGTAVSPDGVTTSVSAPAESTEEEYFHACQTARTWMEQQGGTSKSQIEPYLATLQSSDLAGPGTFETPWSQLTPARQAAVIVAAQAAADALCG